MLLKVKRGEGIGAIGSVLDAAEAASPVESVEAVTRQLALATDATAVSFLIADLSGRALVRLAHVRAQGAGKPAAPDPLRTGNAERLRSPRRCFLSTGGPKNRQSAPRA